VVASRPGRCGKDYETFSQTRRSIRPTPNRGHPGSADAGRRHEVIVGSITDGSFGKLVAFGLGGVLVEVLKTSPSVSRRHKDDALSMLDGIQAMTCSRACAVATRSLARHWRTSLSKCRGSSATSPKSSNSISTRCSLPRRPIAADVRIVVDFDYKPRPAPRPTEEIVAAMNRIMQRWRAVIGASAETQDRNSVMKT